MDKFRTRERPDGSREIIRVLTTEDLQDWKEDNPLGYEQSIVWVRDISRLPFVRVAHAQGVRSRRGRLRLSTGQHVVGYAKLMEDAPRDPQTNGYTRRVFFVTDDDLAAGGAQVPRGAVDPRTVFPGVPGKAPSKLPPSVAQAGPGSSGP